MEKVKVSTFKCKSCGYCIGICPKKAIHMTSNRNAKGYCYVEIDQDACIQCGSCYRICPDYVFEILDTVKQ